MFVFLGVFWVRGGGVGAVVSVGGVISFFRGMVIFWVLDAFFL